MPAISAESPLAQSREEQITRAVLRAVDERWTLGELADALGVTKQTAATYATQRNLEVTRSGIRTPRQEESNGTR